jgi:hypothetical protein
MYLTGKILFWVSEQLDQERRTLLVEPKGNVYEKSAADICNNKEYATAMLNFKHHFVVDVPNIHGVPTTSLQEAPTYQVYLQLA